MSLRFTLKTNWVTGTDFRYYINFYSRSSRLWCVNVTAPPQPGTVKNTPESQLQNSVWAGDVFWFQSCGTIMPSILLQRRQPDIRYGTDGMVDPITHLHELIWASVQPVKSSQWSTAHSVGFNPTPPQIIQLVISITFQCRVDIFVLVCHYTT